MTTFTFGADPEIFVRKNSKPVSAFGLIGGTKESPLKTSVGAVQVDGMALEFNIDPVNSGDFDRFNQNIVKTMGDLKAMVPGYTFDLTPVQEFSPEYMDNQPAEAKELGCDPDYNAYTLKANPRPEGDRPFRTGAGHVHIGWGANIPVDNEEHIEICANFVKYLDATVGLFMTYIDRDPRRRELYGKAGAFRPKPYGVEYRTPSNMWLKNKNRRLLVWALMNKAIFHAKSQTPLPRVSNLEEMRIPEVINSGNWQDALRALDYQLLNHPKETMTAWKAVKAEMAAVQA